MELDTSSLIQASVGHARLWPKKNSFAYRVFYTKIPVSPKNQNKTPALFSFNGWNVFSIFNKDHGDRTKETSWRTYILSELRAAGIPFKTGYKISLIAHPRILGFAFNPISFWFITDKDNRLKAVLCEVMSTFKQTHNYLLAKPNSTTIKPHDVLIADKKLYVSPYNKVEGHYEFSFTYSPAYFKAVINYFDGAGKHILNTYVGGNTEPLTSQAILKSLVRYPAMTVMVVLRIHWQAVKLFFKRVDQTMKTRPRTYKNNQTSVSKKQKQLPRK